MMKTLILSLIFAAVAFCEVRVLTDNDFTSVIQGNDDVFVKFFAPWCGHCKSLAPTFQDLAERYANKKVIIAEVNCDDEKNVCQEYGISGYPTLKYFKRGSPLDYSGGRSIDDLIKYVQQNSGIKPKGGKQSKVVNLSPSNFDEIVKDPTKDVLVKFFAPWCGHCKSLAPKFEKVAGIFQGDENVVVAEIDCDNHKEFCTKYSITGYPTLKFFSKTDKNGVDYSGGREEADFIKYFNRHAGTQRTETGALEPTAGLIPELTTLIEKFIKSDNKKEEAKALLEQVAKRSEEIAKYYEKVIGNYIEKGEEWVLSEIIRLEKIIASGNVSQKKTDFFMKNINVLGLFKGKIEKGQKVDN